MTTPTKSYRKDISDILQAKWESSFKFICRHLTKKSSRVFVNLFLDPIKQIHFLWILSSFSIW